MALEDVNNVVAKVFPESSKNPKPIQMMVMMTTERAKFGITSVSKEPTITRRYPKMKHHLVGYRARQKVATMLNRT